LIFLSLFLAGTATVYLLRAEQEKTARERVGRLAEPVALRAAILEAAGFDAGGIQSLLQEEYGAYGVRILLIDGDTVVEDTGVTLRGEKISQLNQQGIQARPLGDLRFQVQRYRQGPERLLLFTTPQGVVASVPGAGVFVPQFQTAIAVDEGTVEQAWRDLLPRLLLAGGVSLGASVVASSLLARSITRPLRQITDASEEMARGRYDQQIPAYGGEEVRRLAQAFNHMAQQVGRSHRTLRDFLANVSHELKTPLTSIQGFSQAMVDGSLQRPEDFTDAGRIINQEAVRMRGLVDDLLYLSQVEAGEASLQLDQINPNELLLETRKRFNHSAAQKNVRISVQTSGVPAIEADARRLEQALTNIVENAVRHTPAGGSVTLRSGTENGSVLLSVQNSGSFIPTEALPRIFDRFYQVDSQRARADGNTGLGLAITKEIVEAHGGEVTATSSREAGTEFVIALPVKRDPVEPGVTFDAF
jgi:signal transduction histidine kinase